MGDVTETQRGQVPCPQTQASEGGGGIPTEQFDPRSARQTLKPLLILEQTQKHREREVPKRALQSAPL